MASKTGNQKLFIGLIIAALIGAIFALHGLELLPGGYKYAAAVMVGAFFIVALLFLIGVIYRDKIFKSIFGEVDDLDSFRSDAQALVGSVSQTVSDQVTRGLPPEQQQRVRQVAPRLANYLIWGRIRNWWLNWLLTIFVTIGGLATTVLLVNQNKLLKTQNEKIEIQNDKIEIQTHLMEAERRGGQVVLMASVLQGISEETQDQRIDRSTDTGGYHLTMVRCDLSA
jgi:hypothetical protein